jgi:hypothetical protein
MSYYFVCDDELIATLQPPPGAVLLAHRAHELQPAAVTALHRSLRGWARAGYRPGPVIGERVWIAAEDTLAFFFGQETQPAPLLHVGQAPDLAAWLVLLDKWLDTDIVIAAARSVWSPLELAGALTFTTPGFLPRPLLAQPPDNWARVARALAYATVALPGEPQTPTSPP